VPTPRPTPLSARAAAPSPSESRLGAQQRYVGITTVFSSDGSYLLSDKTAVVPYDRYSDALYETLKRSIRTVRKQDNWRSTDKVRLVFHMFKPPKDIEAEAIKKTVEALGLEDVTFAFLHVAPSHPYVIFDNTQKGIATATQRRAFSGHPGGCTRVARRFLRRIRAQAGNTWKCQRRACLSFIGFPLSRT
jgi:hypothetical protein